MKKFAIIFLIILCVGMVFGCGKDSVSENSLVVNTITELEKYTIVRSNEASEIVMKAATSLCTAFYKNAEAKVNVVTDSTDEKAREIIIGNTTRAFAGYDSSGLTLNEFYINMIGEKVFIVGGSDKAVLDGVEFMINNLIVDKALKAPTDNGYKAKNKNAFSDLRIDGNRITEYTIVERLYYDSIAEDFAEIIDKATYFDIPVVSADEFDFDSGKYILLDDTNTDFSSHSVTVEDGNVILFANYVTIESDIDYFFSDVLKFDSENGTLNGTQELNITSEMNKSFTVENSPVYTKEKLLSVLGEVYEDNDRLIIAQNSIGAKGETVTKERSRYLQNCGVELPMIGFDIAEMIYADIERSAEVKDAYDFVQFAREGGIITFSVHFINPADPSFGYRGVLGHEAEWDQLFTEGTELNSTFMAQLREVTDYLEIFHNNGTPIIFRPLHEMNGNWFWFCITNGETGHTLPQEYAQKFWRFLYDYIVIERGIDSMLWEYSPNVNSSAANVMYCYPGDEYCDLVSCDWYTGEYSGHNLLKISYDALAPVGKIFSMSEFGPNGNIMTNLEESPEYKFNCSHLDALITDIRGNGIKMAYFMLWHSYNEVKISMWNMGEAQFFYENEVYLTLEDTCDLLYK